MVLEDDLQGLVGLVLRIVEALHQIMKNTDLEGRQLGHVAVAEVHDLTTWRKGTMITKKDTILTLHLLCGLDPLDLLLDPTQLKATGCLI